MMVAVMVLSFVILIVLFCVRTIVPWNYICLFIFTLMMSYSIGVIGPSRANGRATAARNGHLTGT